MLGVDERDIPSIEKDGKRIYQNGGGGGSSWYDIENKINYALSAAVTVATKANNTLKTLPMVGWGLTALGTINDVLHHVGTENILTNIGIVGVGVASPELGIIFGGVNNIYPGGWKGYAKDTETSLKKVDNSNLSPTLQMMQYSGITNMLGSGTGRF